MTKKFAEDLLKNEFHGISHPGYMQSPEELLNSKRGHCWEQTELARYLFDKQGIPTKSYYIAGSNYDYGQEWPDSAYNNHAFIVFQDNGKFYWYEHSWLTNRGLHEYESLESLLNDVQKRWFEAEIKSFGAPRKNHVLCEFQKPEFPITYRNYGMHCVTTGEFFDWDKPSA